jgi:monofunctional biosynthetic peptidoglycan transglycosylase
VPGRPETAFPATPLERRSERFEHPVALGVVRLSYRAEMGDWVSSRARKSREDGRVKKRLRHRRLLWTALVVLGVLGLLGAWVAAGLPPRAEVQALMKARPGKTALMRQREREAAREGRRPRFSQTWVPLSRVSYHLLHAVLASEDQRFFAHRGIDWAALRESVENNVERRRLWRGGSTLTQQLAKNLFFGTSRTPVRKARELLVTRWLEEDLTKLRILTLYLNVIEWGDGVYGCEAAARHWYGKSASALSAGEAAGLVAMIPNPLRINPQRSPRWFQRARERVLGLMERSGYLERDVAGVGAEPPPGFEPLELELAEPQLTGPDLPELELAEPEPADHPPEHTPDPHDPPPPR